MAALGRLEEHKRMAVANWAVRMSGGSHGNRKGWARASRWLKENFDDPEMHMCARTIKRWMKRREDAQLAGVKLSLPDVMPHQKILDDWTTQVERVEVARNLIDRAIQLTHNNLDIPKLERARINLQIQREVMRHEKEKGDLLEQFVRCFVEPEPARASSDTCLLYTSPSPRD